MRLGSLFDGSGGFPLSGALCGIEPIWASEVEPYPIAVTKSRFPNMKHLGDISKINGAEIEPVDIITFGSPCQDLSVAGKRAGLKHEDNGDDETTRSGLFMEAVRIIKEMREKTNGKYPRFAVWENVPGAFSSNKGEDFRIVLEELIKVVEPSAVMPEVPRFGWAYADSYCGNGWSLAYRVLDAQYWGVPQRRRRIYLVADFGGQCAREILFEREGLRGYFTKGRTPWKTTPTDVERSIGADDREGETAIESVIAFEPGAARRLGGYAWEDVAGTLRAEMGDNQTAVAYGIDHAITTGGNCTAQGSCVYKDVQATLKASGAHAVAYSFDSLSSNSMKSSNPHSGCREVDVSKTLDTSNPDPSKNQGGIAIVEPNAVPCTVISIDRESYNCGYDFDRDPNVSDSGINPTLISRGPSAVCYAVENHPNDSRVKIDSEGKVQALTSRMGTGGGNTPLVMEEKPKIINLNKGDVQSKTVLDPNGIAPSLYAGECRGGGGECYVMDKTIALEGNGQRPSHQGDGYSVTDKSYTLNATEKHGVVYAVDQGGGKSQANVSEDMSPTLTCTHGGEPAVAYGIGIQSSQGIDKIGEDLSPTLINGSNPGWQNGVAIAEKPTVCIETFHCTTEDNITQPLKARDYKDPLTVVFGDKTRYIVRRLTPTECARLQGFADRWGDIDIKTELSDEDYKFWLEVRNTHAAINGKTTKEYTKAQMLTWYNKLPTDSAEYKMWGNGIALPTALYVIQGIAETMKGETNND